MALPEEYVSWVTAAVTIHGLSLAAVDIANKLPIDRLAEEYAVRFELAARTIRERMRLGV